MRVTLSERLLPAVAALVLFPILASAGSGALNEGEYLFPGQMITQSCFYRTYMENDGRLVTMGGNSEVHALFGSSGGYIAVGGGNFRFYNWSDQVTYQSNNFATCNEEEWIHNGGKCLGSGSLRQQDDGNLVHYWNGNATWASNIVRPVQGQSCAPFRETKTQVDRNKDRLGGDYRSIDLAQARWSWCAYHCAQDSSCRSFTYVPPGIKGPSAVCFLKNTVPSLSNNQGMVSGRIIGR